MASTCNVWLQSVDFEHLPRPLFSQRRIVHQVAFTSDSKRLIVTDEFGLGIWDIESGAIIHSLVGHPGPAACIAIVGDRLFSSGLYNEVCVWDIDRGKLLHKIGHPSLLDDRHLGVRGISPIHGYFHLSVSYSNNVIAVAGYRQNQVRILDANTYEVKAEVDVNQRHTVFDLSFSQDGLSLAITQAFDGYWWYSVFSVADGTNEDDLWKTEDHEKTEAWNPLSGSTEPTHLKSIDRDTHIELPMDIGLQAVWSRDRSKFIASGPCGTLGLWQSKPRHKLKSSEATYQSIGNYIIFSPDSQQLLTPEYWVHNSIHGWQTETGIPICRVVQGVEGGFSNSGSRVFFDNRGNLILIASDWQNNLYVWDVEHDQSILSIPLPDHHHLPNSFVITPDWRYFITGSEFDKMRIWNLFDGTNEVLWYTENHNSRVMDIDSSGRFVAAITAESSNPTVYKTLRVFDIQQKVEIFTLEPAFKATFLTGTTILFVSSRGPKKPGCIEIWDIISQELLGTLPEITPYEKDLSFSPDGQLVFLPMESTVEMWDWRSNRMVTSFSVAVNEDDSNIFAGRISPDGMLYATISSQSKELTIWGVPNTS